MQEHVGSSGRNHLVADQVMREGSQDPGVAAGFRKRSRDDQEDERSKVKLPPQLDNGWGPGQGSGNRSVSADGGGQVFSQQALTNEAPAGVAFTHEGKAWTHQEVAVKYDEHM